MANQNERIQELEHQVILLRAAVKALISADQSTLATGLYFSKGDADKSEDFLSNTESLHDAIAESLGLKELSSEVLSNGKE